MRDTIEMAREAGFPLAWISDSHGGVIRWKDLKAFEALVRADEREQGQKWFDAVTAQHRAEILAEREACAKVADRYVGADPIADAIRARGETK
jgi:hypothetical protein